MKFLPGTAPTADDASAWFGTGPAGKPRLLLLLPAEYAAWCQMPAFNTLGAIHPPDQHLTIAQPRD